MNLMSLVGITLISLHWTMPCISPRDWNHVHGLEGAAQEKCASNKRFVCTVGTASLQEPEAETKGSNLPVITKAYHTKRKMKGLKSAVPLLLYELCTIIMIPLIRTM